MSAQEKEKEPKESKPKDTKISEIPNVKIERFGNKEKEEEAKVIISTKEEIEQRKERFKDQYEIIQAEKEKKKEEDDEKEKQREKKKKKNYKYRNNNYNGYRNRNNYYHRRDDRYRGGRFHSNRRFKNY